MLLTPPLKSLSQPSPLREEQLFSQQLLINSNQDESMQNYAFNLGVPRLWLPNKLLLIMKLIIIILITSLMQVSAAGFAQKVTLNEKNAHLESVISKIRSQTGYDFVFDFRLLESARKVNLNVKNEKLESALKKVFDKQDLDFTIKDNIIVLDKKERTGTAHFSNIDVWGRVLDESGMPLAKATIKVKGQSIMVLTTDNGEFVLKNVPKDAILIVSFIGYISKEVPVKENVGSIELLPGNSSLNDVIVVGYGTQKRINLTGAIAQVKGEELMKAPVSNLGNSLIGRLPGLRAIQNSGEPGRDGSNIDIRGFGSALIIVDGIPSDFSQLDANEIESFSILKDASAAVYGVRAANGVVLITTKKGAVGKPRINYSTYFGVQNNASEYPELADASLYSELTNEGAVNAWVKLRNPGAALSLPYTKEQVQQYKDGTLPSYNWWDATIRKNAPQYYHNLNLDGGNEDVKYFLNLAYLNQDAMWKSNSTQFKRYNFRGKVIANINKRLTAELNLSGNLEDRATPGLDGSGIISTVRRTFPISPIYANDNPDYLATSNALINPLAEANSSISGYNSNKARYFSGIAALSYRIPGIDGLNAKLSYSYQNTDQNIKNHRKKFNLYNYNKTSNTYDAAFTVNDPSNLTIISNHQDNQLLQASLNYEKTFNSNHHVTGLFVFERNETNASDLSAYKEFFLDDLDELFAGVANNQRNSGSSAETAREGYIGKFNYDYSGKYLVEFGFRYDGTYKVEAKQRFGFFPTVSAGWRISEENFMKNNATIDNLKLRASWGKVGDDSGINPFQYIPGYNYPSGNYLFGTRLTPGLIAGGLTNPLLTWFTSYTSNIGVDVSLWNGFLGASVDVFYRKRTGLLATRVSTLPNTFGATLPQENLNGDNTRGFEIEITHKHEIGKVKYSVSPNFSFTRSKYGYLEQNPQSNSLNNYLNNNADRWMNIYKGYVSTGQFQSQSEINTAPVQDAQGNKTILPGDIRYKDLNGDGVINGSDQTVIGRGNTPEIFYGLNLNANYGGFDFSVLLQGATNFNRYYDSALQNPFINNSNTFAMFADRWHRQDLYDVNSPWIPGKYPSTIISGAANNQLVSSFWLQDGTYLRIKNVNIGYTLDKKLTEKVGIRTVRVYVAGQNVFTLSKIKVIDPEAPSGGGGFYPQQKIWSLGLNVGF